MSRSDELLWELPRVEEELERPLPSDEELRAYRAGTLPAEQATRLEWELGRSSTARGRLLALAAGDTGGEPVDEAVDRVRRRLFVCSGARRGRRWWALAASVAGLVALSATLWLLGTPRGTPTLVASDFVVTLEGLATVRSGSGAASAALVEARADTRVRVGVETLGPARAGSAWAIYLDEGARLRRVDDAPGVRSEIGRGAAAFEAPARALVGERPGEYRLLVVAAPAERLVAMIERPAGRSAADAVTDATGGSVVERELRLIADGQEDRR